MMSHGNLKVLEWMDKNRLRLIGEYLMPTEPKNSPLWPVNDVYLAFMVLTTSLRVSRRK